MNFSASELSVCMIMGILLQQYKMDKQAVILEFKLSLQGVGLSSLRLFIRLCHGITVPKWHFPKGFLWIVCVCVCVLPPEWSFKGDDAWILVEYSAVFNAILHFSVSSPYTCKWPSLSHQALGGISLFPKLRNSDGFQKPFGPYKEREETKPIMFFPVQRERLGLLS